MDDLIYRDHAIIHIECEYFKYGDNYDANDILDYLENMPTAAVDAVKITRCEHCQNKEESLDEEFDYWCLHHGSYVYKDDFCSYGED